VNGVLRGKRILVVEDEPLVAMMRTSCSAKTPW